MPAHNNIPDLQIFGKGSGDFKLPSGYVDKEGRVFNQIYLREMTGVEDDIMDDDELNVSERMSRVISNCTEKLSTNAGAGEEGTLPTVIDDPKLILAAVSDNLTDGGLPFTIPDRMACLLFIRRLSMGDLYDLKGHPCPACGKGLKNKHINLDSLAITYCKDATKRRVKTTLPRSGKVAILRVLSAGKERQISEFRPDQKNIKSAAILARLEALGGNTMTGNTKDDIEMIKALPKLDRLRLLNIFNAMEGSIETEIETNCTAGGCGVAFKFDLDLGQVFFSNPDLEVSLDELEWV